MLRKYIVSSTGKQFFITKFYIFLFDTTLRLAYEVYKINNLNAASMINNIDQSFKNNPEADSIFEKLPLVKKFSKHISQIEAGNIVENLEKILLKKQLEKYIKVELIDLTLYYEIDKIKLLHNFINNFYTNYETLKLSLLKPIAQSTPLLNEQLKSSNIDNKNIISNIFERLLQLSPNNIITFYILKNIILVETNQKVNFILSNENELKIEIAEFQPNLLLLYNDLSILLNTEIIDKTLIRKNIAVLINAITFIYENKENIENDKLYLFLNIILLLIYIYGYWLNNNQSSNTIYNFVNKILENINNKNKFKKIEFICLKNLNDNFETVDLNSINLLAKKYNYLINIDKERFIKNILDELPKNNKEKFSPKFILSKPKLINLNNEPLPLGYNIIKDTQFENKIISKPYYDLLVINNSSNIFNSKELDSRVIKLIDIINNKIIPKINKQIEMIRLNSSTFFIYNEFIEPFIDNNIISLEEKLFLIFDITIPYLYDNFKIDKFLDHLH